MRDTTTRGLTFTRPLPQGSAAPTWDAFWTDEYGWLVPTDKPMYQRIDTNYTEQVQHVFEFMFEYLNAHGVLVEIGGTR